MPGSPERAVHYYVEAGRAALKRFAHEEARDYFVRARELLAHHAVTPRQWMSCWGSETPWWRAGCELALARHYLQEGDRATAANRLDGVEAVARSLGFGYLVSEVSRIRPGLP